MAVTLDKRALERRMAALEIASQKELATRAEMDYYHLNRIINGHAFTSTTLGRLALVLDCSPRSLVSP